MRAVLFTAARTSAAASLASFACPRATSWTSCPAPPSSSLGSSSPGSSLRARTGGTWSGGSSTRRQGGQMPCTSVAEGYEREEDPHRPVVGSHMYRKAYGTSTIVRTHTCTPRIQPRMSLSNGLLPKEEPLVSRRLLSPHVVARLVRSSAVQLRKCGTRTRRRSDVSVRLRA